MLNCVLNEHVVGGENPGKQKITFPTAERAQPGFQRRKQCPYSFFFLQGSSKQYKLLRKLCINTEAITTGFLQRRLSFSCGVCALFTGTTEEHISTSVMFQRTHARL